MADFYDPACPTDDPLEDEAEPAESPTKLLSISLPRIKHPSAPGDAAEHKSHLPLTRQQQTTADVCHARQPQGQTSEECHDLPLPSTLNINLDDVPLPPMPPAEPSLPQSKSRGKKRKKKKHVFSDEEPPPPPPPPVSPRRTRQRSSSRTSEPSGESEGTPPPPPPPSQVESVHLPSADSKPEPELSLAQKLLNKVRGQSSGTTDARNVVCKFN